MNQAMKAITVEKITVNIGAGKDQKQLEKAKSLIKHITNIDPVPTKTNKRIAGWGLRPGLPIGAKVTLRGKDAVVLLKRFLEAKDMQLREKSFDDQGNISFGIHEYIDIPQTKYDPKIGSMGLECAVTLQRPGYRVMKRRIGKVKIPRRHRINKQEAITFMKNTFKISVGESA